MGNYISSEKENKKISWERNENYEEKEFKIEITVPDKKKYEINNGLLKMKRDVNLKLVFYLADDENKIRQVFLFLLFDLIFLDIYSKFRIFYLENALSFCLSEKYILSILLFFF
jgi:hypothetical protein